MDKKMIQNFDALISFSLTEDLESFSHNYTVMDSLIQKSNFFLSCFHTIENSLATTSEEQTKKVLKLMTKRDIYRSICNNGLDYTLKSIKERLDLKEDPKVLEEAPTIVVTTDQEYFLFFDRAQHAYMESDKYHQVRFEQGEDIAKHNFYRHWSVLGEIFNRTMAQQYVASLEQRQVEDIPIIYKNTHSGNKYFALPKEEKNKLKNAI